MAFVKGKLPLWLKLTNGSGSIAFGVKDGGFSFFLLPFYNLVLGVEAWVVSAALATALIVDALVDPLLGHLSDRTYTRWGRRLPWLYIAPFPLAVVWTLLWSPPFAGTPSYLEIVALAVGVRLLLSACEVPSVSIVPEITDDYVERTTLFRFRFLAGWLGGLLMMVMTFTVFLPTPEAQLRPEGYAAYGLFGAVLMVISVVASAAGQHRIIAKRPKQKPPPFSLSGAFEEIFDAFKEKAFVIFALGGLAAYVGQGMTFSITQYVNLYIWQFSDIAFRLYPGVLFLSVILMFVIVGPLHERYGKPASAAVAALISSGIYFTPYLLLLLGVWPQTGSNLSTGLVLGFLLFGNTAGIVAIISATSMVAEIVEAYEERTGKRAEGTFYSGNWLVQKCATGGGILLTGLLISLVGLEPGTPQAEVSGDIVRNLAVLYMVTAVGVALFSAYWLARFPITREQHESRVAAREAREGNLAAQNAPMEASGNPGAPALAPPSIEPAK